MEILSQLHISFKNIPVYYPALACTTQYGNNNKLATPVQSPCKTPAPLTLHFHFSPKKKEQNIELVQNLYGIL